MRAAEKVFDAVMYPLETVALRAKRRALIPKAKGRVLEIGAGTGANLPHYRYSQIEALHLLDLSIADSLAEFSPDRGGGRSAAAISLHEGRAEELPFPDSSFDTVVFTLVFCSVEDVKRGFAEVRRVLAPEGRVLFVEHVRPSGRMLAMGADLFNPCWHMITGECNVNRDTESELRRAGFSFAEFMRTGHGLLIEGVAEL